MKGNHNPTNNQDPTEVHHLPSADEPAVYAASLADYNVGHLHGRWVSADQEPDAIQSQIDEMLAASTEAIAEEWAIHDYQGFGSLALSEYERIETISTIGQGIVEHGLAYADWAQVVGADQVQDHDFDAHYRGHWDNLETYADHMLEDLGLNPSEPLTSDDSWLNRYLTFDINQLAHDLAHDLEIAQAPDGGIHIFDPPQ